MRHGMTYDIWHMTHKAWHMTTKSLHNTYFHKHWPTTTLGMQHTATTQYTSYIIQTSIMPWSQIHGTGQSKPRTSIVIYVDFNEMLIHPADIQHRHTTGDRQSFNTRLHTQLTAIQSHILAQHKLHSIQLHTSNNNHKEHLLWWGKMGWNASNNDTAAQFNRRGKTLVLPRWNTTVNWMQYQKPELIYREPAECVNHWLANPTPTGAAYRPTNTTKQHTSAIT